MNVHLVILTGAWNMRPVEESSIYWSNSDAFTLTKFVLDSWGKESCCGPFAMFPQSASLPVAVHFCWTHLTPTTCTPNSLALSSRCLQSLREQPKDMLISLSWLDASVETCSSSLNVIKDCDYRFTEKNESRLVKYKWYTTRMRCSNDF